MEHNIETVKIKGKANKEQQVTHVRNRSNMHNIPNTNKWDLQVDPQLEHNKILHAATQNIQNTSKFKNPIRNNPVILEPRTIKKCK